MSLRFAIMAALLDGEASGYELAKRFDISVANFWYALPQQLYAELNRMEHDGLVTATMVIQERRPNKHILALSDAGREALRQWAREPARRASVKDDLLVRLYAADIVDPEALLAVLEKRLAQHEDKLQRLEAVRDEILKGRSEEEYVRAARRIGPYLPLRLGIAVQREHVAWCQWAAETLRLRMDARHAPRRRHTSS